MNKNKFYHVLSLMLMAFSLVGTSCRQEESPSIDDYPLNYQIPTIKLTKSATVGAIYSFNGVRTDNGQYDRLIAEYDPSTTPYPQLGAHIRPVLQNYTYNTNSAETIDLFQQHIDWAIEAGIDYLILPEVGYDANQPNLLNKGSVDRISFMEGLQGLALEKMNWHDLKFCISVKPSDVVPNTSNSVMVEDDADEAGNSAHVQTLCKYFIGLADRFFRDDSLYFKQDGKAMVVINNPQDLHCRDSRKVYDAIRDAVREASGVELYLVARQNQWTPTARWENSFVTGGFDSFFMNTMYQDGTWQRYGDYRPQYIDQNFKYNAEWAKKNANLDFIPSISPAFNAWVMGSGQNNYNFPIEPYDETRFRIMCNVAKNNMSANNMVIIDSFNNWQSVTAIEPTDPYYGNGFGLKMLEIVKSEFKVN